MTLTVRITNDGTGGDAAANYDYVATTNHEVVATGRLEKFNRLDGWLELVRLFTREEERKLADSQKRNPPKDPEKTGRYCTACGAELKYRNASYMCVRRGCRKYGRRV